MLMIQNSALLWGEGGTSRAKPISGWTCSTRKVLAQCEDKDDYKYKSLVHSFPASLLHGT